MKGVCKVCGCTMKNPCFSHRYGFCWWPTFEEDICSHCENPEIKDDPNTIHCVHGLEFPVLSVHQPYALMLVEGKKPFEYRSWKLPKRYVGQRIFIQATKMMDDFDPQFAEKEAFTECMYRAYDNELNSMILGSVVFGESEESIECTVNGMKKLLFKWPVLDPIKLDDPLKFIPGKQGIWKIQF